jgi:RNA polymerase sigma-70 factor (ECF subfamily)
MLEKENTELEDVVLAKACLEGDTKAQHQLFMKYSKQMMAICLRYAHDYDEACDLLQDGFIKVFAKLSMYNGNGPLGAWIRRTVVNNALDHLRRTKREMAQYEDLRVEAAFNNPDYEEAFEIDQADSLSEERIIALVQSMPAGYRTVFNLYAIEEYSHREIAEMLGITESTSKTQYRKAKAFMRQLIENELKTSQREEPHI